MEAHYAAAKTGLVGLTNVIAIEGEPHGILANAVLPTGFSRMVTETVGDEKFLTESGFMRAIRPELVVPLVVFLASTELRLHPPQLLGVRRPLRPGVRRPRGRAGWPTPTAVPTAEDIETHLDEVSATDKFIVPESIVDEVLDVCSRRGISAMPGNAEIAFPEPERQGSAT